MKFLLIILISSLFARDNQVPQCGHYQIEGKLTKKGNQYRFYANPKSEAEVNIGLGRKIPKEAQKYLNAHVISTIEIRKACRYSCMGRLHEVKSQVSPSRPLNLFIPKRDLIKRVKCSLR